MRNHPVVYLVGQDVATQRTLIVALESAGLHLQTFSTAEEFTAQCQGDEYGCLLLDWHPGDSACAQLLKKLSDAKSCLPVIIIIEYPDAAVAVECIRLGAVSYLHRPLDRQVLLPKIRAALAEASIAVSSAARLSALTPREREMLQLLIEGKSSKQIAVEKGLSLRTVKNHRVHLLAKTGAENTADLVRMAMVVGITRTAS